MDNLNRLSWRGDCCPRSYTVRTILAALDYDLSKISDNDADSKSFSEWLKEIFLIDIDPDRSGTSIPEIKIL